jgi:hypothetical protein
MCDTLLIIIIKIVNAILNNMSAISWLSFFWWIKPHYLKKSTDIRQVTVGNRIMLYRVHLKLCTNRPCRHKWISILMTSALFYTNSLIWIFIVLAPWNNRPLGHIFLIPRKQSVPTSSCCVLRGEAVNTNVIIFDWTCRNRKDLHHDKYIYWIVKIYIKTNIYTEPMLSVLCSLKLVLNGHDVQFIVITTIIHEKINDVKGSFMTYSRIWNKRNTTGGNCMGTHCSTGAPEFIPISF